MYSWVMHEWENIPTQFGMSFKRSPRGDHVCSYICSNIHWTTNSDLSICAEIPNSLGLAAWRRRNVSKFRCAYCVPMFLVYTQHAACFRLFVNIDRIVKFDSGCVYERQRRRVYIYGICSDRTLGASACPSRHNSVETENITQIHFPP